MDRAWDIDDRDYRVKSIERTKRFEYWTRITREARELREFPFDYERPLKFIPRVKKPLYLRFIGFLKSLLP